MSSDKPETKSTKPVNTFTLSSTLTGFPSVCRDVTTNSKQELVVACSGGTVHVTKPTVLTSQQADEKDATIFQELSASSTKSKVHSAAAYNVCGLGNFGDGFLSSGKPNSLHFRDGDHDFSWSLPTKDKKEAKTIYGSIQLLIDQSPVNKDSDARPAVAIMTGDWSGRIRVWEPEWVDGRLVSCGLRYEICDDHKYSTMCAVLDTERGGDGERGVYHIVAGSGHFGLYLYRFVWGKDNRWTHRVICRVDKAHDHVVKRVIPLGRDSDGSLRFMSAGNDGVMRVWSYSHAGKQPSCDVSLTLDAGQFEEVKFIHGATAWTRLGPDAKKDWFFAASLEAGTVVVFKGERCVQRIQHPGAVWGCTFLQNGDLATACSDRTTRIFTRAPARHAPQKLQDQFSNMAAMAMMAREQKSGGGGGVDLSKYPDESDLQTPGTKQGQMKIVNHSRIGKTLVYSWDVKDNEWKLYGEAQTSPGSSSNANRERSSSGTFYDRVVMVQLSQDVNRELGVNRDDDPEEVAANFCSRNGLSPDFRGQIVAFIKQNGLVEPGAHLRKRQQSGSGSVGGNGGVSGNGRPDFKYLPSHQVFGYQYHNNSPPFEKVQKRIQTSSEELAGSEEEKSLALSSQETEALETLYAALAKQESFQEKNSDIGDSQVAVLKRMLIEWPDQHCLMPLDLIRLTLLTVSGGALIALDRDLMERAASLIGKTPQLSLVGTRVVANWVGRRASTAEKKLDPYPNWAVGLVSGVLSQVPSARVKDESKRPSANLLAAYGMLCYNAGCWIGTNEWCFTLDAFTPLIQAARELVTVRGDNTPDNRTSCPSVALFSALGAVGTVMLAGQEAANSVLQLLSRQVLANAINSAADRRQTGPSGEACADLAQDMASLLKWLASGSR